MRKYRARVDRLFFLIFIPLLAILLSVTVVLGVLDSVTLFWLLPIDIFTLYFLISPLFGYCELREEGLFIRYGFIITRYIPYEKIRGIEEKRAFYTNSMLSLKCAFSHIDIKYNLYDLTSVGVRESDELIRRLGEKINGTM